MIYNKYKRSLIASLLTDTVKVAILLDSYVPNQAHEFFSDVSAHQIVITGYTTGGQALAGKALTQVDNLFKFLATNPTWAITGTASFKHAVFYVDTGTPSTSRLITFHTFGLLRTIINGNLTLEIPSTGIFSLQ